MLKSESSTLLMVPWGHHIPYQKCLVGTSYSPNTLHTHTVTTVTTNPSDFWAKDNFSSEIVHVKLISK